MLDDGDVSAGYREVAEDDGTTIDADEALNTDDLDRYLDRGVDAVEAALAMAIAKAATAGRFDVVAQLARELEGRRLSRAGERRVARRRAP